MLLKRADRPTMYFIGVTTAQSSIMKIFPLWADILGIQDAVIRGVDVGIHAEPGVYREIVEFIKGDALSLGALVTTHKIDLYNACADLFEYLDPFARMFGELSSISKKNGRLEGYAKDPISSGLSMESFIPSGYWRDHGGETFMIGAGGSAIAISSYLLDRNKGTDIPSRYVVGNRSQARLSQIERIIRQINPTARVEYHLTPDPAINDRILAGLKPYSLIVNATGLGKDRPGSPLTDACVFPSGSLVWELNYRGELGFMHQARRQKETRGLRIEDGWVYFIHGWTQVISEVFHIEIGGSVFQRCKEVANILYAKNGD